VKVVALADTHIAESGHSRLPAAAWRLVEEADVVLHAGDVTGPRFLDELEQVAVVHAVLGNNDRDLADRLPVSLQIELGGVQVAMVHESGARTGREGRLHRRFPDARLVVFGHSHQPWNAEGVDGQLLVNPGSATQRRAGPHRTLARFELDAGRVVRVEHVVLD
jgi:putative phosphoesterase